MSSSRRDAEPGDFIAQKRGPFQRKAHMLRQRNVLFYSDDHALHCLNVA